jgi:hypothetical protein
MVGEAVEVGVKVGEAGSGVFISVGAEVGALIPLWEQASRNEESAAATPIVATKRKKSCRLKAGFFLEGYIFASYVTTTNDDFRSIPAKLGSCHP